MEHRDLDNIEKKELEFLASTMAFISCRERLMKATVLAESSCSFYISQDSLHSAVVCRHESGRSHSFLPYLAIFFYYFTSPDFSFTFQSGRF